MGYWIFKLAEQELYPDVPGSIYGYDNRHSTRVRAGDIFIYLDKRQGYSFTGTGGIRKIEERTPTAVEMKQRSKVRTIYTAVLEDVLWFDKPLSISPITKSGKRNRAQLGIIDVNLLGWSHSIPSLGEAMYQAIMDLAQSENIITSGLVSPKNYSIPDVWGKTKIRRVISQFTNTVLARHGKKCVVCGTELTGVIEVAHLSPYSSDKNNRANPGNGICACAYCHRALDKRLIAISPDGKLHIARGIDDPVALYQFQRITPETRKQWLYGVESEFLELTVRWFDERNNDNL